MNVIFIEFNKQLGKVIKCEACREFYHFFATSLITLIIQEQHVRFYLSHDITILKKSRFWREKVKISPYFTKHYNGRHYVTLRNL